MLTPIFELTQTEKSISLKIKAPLANVGKAELVVEDDMVLFHSSPYYLRIHLPGCVREIEGSVGKYDSDRGEFNFEMAKCTPGQHFEDLDMIGKLLLPQKSHAEIKPKIEVLGEDQINVDDGMTDDEDWFIEQEEMCEENLMLTASGRYGFANKLCGLNWVDRDEFSEILDLKGVDFGSIRERTRERRENEGKEFCEDHYLADFMEPDDLLREVLAYVPPWQAESEFLCFVSAKFTSEEREELKKLGNRDYLLDKTEQKIALLSLVDIIFSYAYNHRMTMGDNSVESAWTINKLSATLSWFQSYTDMKDVKVTCARRAIIYPLCRHWELTQTVFKDTHTLLSLGRRQLIKCLLEIHSLFNASHPRYMLNRLYITDYCIWLQKCSEKTIQRLADLFSKVTSIFHLKLYYLSRSTEKTRP
ncbi:hypothetical protein AAG570_004412 [Ranatra chinensis]|uniref:Protein SHQ1 homolog n=1 Tax=Ranatra chinensis TaxID=642074 RepID=A0ABD0Y0S7_9HEMI